jgi:hypothetical protein
LPTFLPFDQIGIFLRKNALYLLLVIIWVTTAFAPSVLAHGISDSDRHDMVAGGYLQYIELGASHMVTGYDHLLFLLGVVFFLTKFRDIAKFVTAFTIGHSITLIFATFLGITANYFLVDAVIALTVVYKGFDNLGGFKKVFGIESPNLMALVFAFGLIHGFGLSTRLQQLPLGDSGLLGRILSFNLGVELGQIAALSVMLLVLNLWRRSASFLRFSKAVNLGLILAGLGLFVFQLNGFAAEVRHGTEAVATSEWRDVKTIVIPAHGSLEYKVAVEEGEVFEYEWLTPGTALYFDFHGEAFDAAPDEFTSFKVTTDSESSGSLTAPFTGRAGWYWRNDGETAAVITLSIRGDYDLIEHD